MGMKTVNYIIAITAEADEAISKLSHAIPCWVNIFPIDDDYAEVEIRCMNENIAYVERTLAEFV
jgi:hypothetical protein